jgi:TatA/E family protein of Tat protein translocase
VIALHGTSKLRVFYVTLYRCASCPDYFRRKIDLFIILLIALVLFGAKKLSDLARALGQSMNEFRKAREEKAVRVEGKQGTLARKDWRIGTTFCAIFFDIFACSAKNSR